MVRRRGRKNESQETHWVKLYHTVAAKVAAKKMNPDVLSGV